MCKYCQTENDLFTNKDVIVVVKMKVVYLQIQGEIEPSATGHMPLELINLERNNDNTYKNKKTNKCQQTN